MRILVFLFIILVAGCTTQKQSEMSDKPVSPIPVPLEEAHVNEQKRMNKTSDPVGEKGQIVTAEIVSKPFMKKNNTPTDRMEMYVRRSIQDYFIKFCESAVTAEEVQSALAQNGNAFLSLEIEIKDGEWDSCDGEPVQSRIGAYVVIHKIQ